MKLSSRILLPRRQLGFIGALGGFLDFVGGSSAADAVATDAAGSAAAGGSSGGLLGSLGQFLPFIGGALGGAASYASSANTNATNLEIANQVNQASMDRQKETQGWEANMANTAEQRQVADLKAAGLNPMLAAHGSGAAVPNVPAPPVQAPQYQNGLGSAVGTAVNTASALSNMKLQQEQIQLTAAQADKTFADSQQSSWDAASKLIDLQEKKFQQGKGSWDIDYGNLIDRNLLLDAQIQSEQKKQRLMDLQAISDQYALPKQKNAADVSSSWVGRNILPYWNAFGFGVKGGTSGFTGSMGQ